MIKARRKTVSTTLSITEKKKLDNIADEWGLKPGMILRRLILLLLQGKITLLDVLSKPSVQEMDMSEERNFHPVRVSLSDSEKENLTKISKEWDFTVTAILRRLVRALLSNDIRKEDLWLI